MKNSIEFKLWGRYALFSDPLTRIGGEKCSYQIPTYEALKGVVKSIYWKPTIVWYIDKVRIVKSIRMQTKGAKPLNYGGGNGLAVYTYLSDVEYQVQAHFEWNQFRPELANDRNDGKHFESANRSLEKGGRQDIFLGVRDCQGYVEPCNFGDGEGHYDQIDLLEFSLMFFGFQYPDESGENTLKTLLWRPKMEKGIISFPRPEEIDVVRDIRTMRAKKFDIGHNLTLAE